jgi:hypothetical protein
MRRCSPTTSWLPHAPARQENAGGRASEQDIDVVADLTGARRRCRVAPVVGEVNHTSRSFSEVGGCSGPAEEERGRLVRSGNGEPVAEIGVEAVASLPVNSEASGADKMQGRRGPFVPA